MALVLIGGGSLASAAVVLTGDPPYPDPQDAVVFTVDPETASGAQRGITTDRNLRQTFQVPTTFNVGELIVSANVEPTATTAGLQMRIFEVDDVLGAWAPGNLIREFIFPTVPAELPGASTVRLGFTFTGGDVFTLPQRNSGSLGYGIEFSNNDGASVFAQLRHTNDGVDYYAGGRYYSETGPSTATRDIGLALVGTATTPAAPGDVDGDGVVDLIDLTFIRNHFRQNGSRDDGDLTGDGFIDLFDFREWKANYPLAFPGSGAFAGLAVPEPASLALTVVGLIGGCALVARRRAFGT